MLKGASYLGREGEGGGGGWASLFAFFGGLSLAFLGASLMFAAFIANVGLLGFLRIREHLADTYSVKTTKSTKVVDALRKVEAAVRGVKAREESLWKKAKPDPKRMLYIIPAVCSEAFGFVSYLHWSNPFSTHPATDAREYIARKYMEEISSTAALPPPPPPPPPPP
jgi:Zn-dependent protease with chaperone function